MAVSRTRSSTRTTTSPDPGSGRHSPGQVPVAAVGAGNHPQTGRCRGRTSCCTTCRTLTASDRQSSPRCALQMSSLGSKPAILQWRIDAVETGRPVMPRQIITTADAPSSPLYSLGVQAGPHVLVSGIVGIDQSTGSLRRHDPRPDTTGADELPGHTPGRRRQPGRRHRGGNTAHQPRRLRRPERGIRAVVPIRAANPLRRQARRRTARTVRLDPDDSIHYLKSAAGRRPQLGPHPPARPPAAGRGGAARRRPAPAGPRTSG
jgi:hypothetical protein